MTARSRPRSAPRIFGRLGSLSTREITRKKNIRPPVLFFVGGGVVFLSFLSFFLLDFFIDRVA